MQNQSQRLIRQLSWWLFLVAWFAGWHFLITRQVWADPANRLPGPTGDNTVMVWNLGWVKYALDHHTTGFWFQNAYFPRGFFFLYGTHTWLNGLFYWMAAPLLPSGYHGAILFANIMLLFATVISGLALVCGLKAWGIRQPGILLLASSAAVFSWFRTFALTGHYHFYGTEWMLLTLCTLSWARASELAGHHARFRGRCIAAGLLLGIGFLNDQTMTIFASILGGLILLFLPWTRPRRWFARLFTAAGLFYGASVITASVHLLPLIKTVLEGKVDIHVDKTYLRLVDASSLLIPPRYHWLGGHLQGLRERYGLAWAEGTYLGVVPLIMLSLAALTTLRFALGKAKARSQTHGHRRFQIAVITLIACAFVVAAMGDRLSIGRHVWFLIPGRILREIPVLNNIRLPQRWIWPAQLCIALAGAFVLSAGHACWLRRGNYRSRRFCATAILLFASCIPPLEAVSWPPVPPTDYRNDHVLHPQGIIEAVQASYRGGGVLTMPTEAAYAHGNVFQFMWGYDIPLSISYTARMPVSPQQLPWKWNNWTPEAGQWLKDHEVKMVVFPFHGGKVEEFQSWIQNATKAVPGLQVLNRNGQRIN